MAREFLPKPTQRDLQDTTPVLTGWPFRLVLVSHRLMRLKIMKATLVLILVVVAHAVEMKTMIMMVVWMIHMKMPVPSRAKQASLELREETL